MSELQIALAAAAVVIVLAVAGWSKWQEYRQLRSLREQLGTPDGDPLLDAATDHRQRIEPSFGALAAAAAPRADLHPRPQLAEWTEDPLLDCVLELRCAHAVDGVAVIDAAATLLRPDAGLPVHLVAWDGRTQQWVVPDRFGFYSELLAAKQLADRNRTLDDIEASKFIAAVQQIALALEADFDPPDVPRMKTLAADLHALAARFDAQIGLTLEPPDGAFSPLQVQAAAQTLGLTAAGERCWQRLGDDGVALFSLRLAAAPHAKLTAELDVPQVTAAAKPLRAMFATATELTALLNARMVDDRGKPIQPGSVESIEAQLEVLYEQMRAAGIEAGAMRARRLYT